MLLGLASSWGTFWLSGQFLDRQGFLFASTNFSSVLGYAVRVHPFLVYGMPWVLVALACGLAALALTRVISSLLVGVRPTDPVTIAGISAGFLIVAALACWLPARRAAGLDPSAALREE